MEQRFVKRSRYHTRVKGNLIIAILLMLVVSGLIIWATDWVVFPSVIAGSSASFAVRYIQLSVPVKIRGGVLYQRTANLNWVDEVHLSQVATIARHEENSPTIAGIFNPAQGVKLSLNSGKEIFVECDSDAFINTLRMECSNARFV